MTANSELDKKEYNRLQRDLDAVEKKDDYGRLQARLRQEVQRTNHPENAFTIMRVSVDVQKDAGAGNVEQILKASIRERDLLCPLENAQFAIVFPDTNEQYAEVIAQRIKGNVSQKTKTYLLETDIGIACFPHDGTSAEDLLESAEQDLISQRKRRHH